MRNNRVTQQQFIYAYGIRCTDGMYIRLYRADELIGMDLNTIASNQGPQGLIRTGGRLLQLGHPRQQRGCRSPRNH